MESKTTLQSQVHGVALELRGTGILLLGESGSGKSTVALALLKRGGKLVADDAVIIRTERFGRLTAEPHPRIRGLLYVRQFGLIRVPNVFGTAAVSERCAVDICFLLRDVRDRGLIGAYISGAVGLEASTVPLIRIPIRGVAGIADRIEESVLKFRRGAIAFAKF